MAEPLNLDMQTLQATMRLLPVQITLKLLVLPAFKTIISFLKLGLASFAKPDLTLKNAFSLDKLNYLMPKLVDPDVYFQPVSA